MFRARMMSADGETRSPRWTRAGDGVEVANEVWPGSDVPLAIDAGNAELPDIGSNGNWRDCGATALAPHARRAREAGSSNRGPVRLAAPLAYIGLICLAAAPAQAQMLSFDRPGPELYRDDPGIAPISTDAFLWRPPSEAGRWAVGRSLPHDAGYIGRSPGSGGAIWPPGGLPYEAMETSLFGQYSLNLTGRLLVTAGGHLTYVRAVGRPLDSPDIVEAPRSSDFRLAPSVALSWRAGRNTLFYTRRQQGFRAGDLAISAIGSSIIAARSPSERLKMVEAGIRLGEPGTGRFSLNAAVSYVRWANIQADLIDSRGVPVTANIGSGRIYGAEIEGIWRPTRSLSFEMAAFLSDSVLSNPDPAFVGAIGRNLPNVAGRGGRLAARYRARVAPGIDLSIDGMLRYVGPSRPGVGNPLDIAQRGYLDSRIGARLDFGRFGVSLDVDNIGDWAGNRFAFGHAFDVGSGNQMTPLRPRTMRIGFSASF